MSGPNPLVSQYDRTYYPAPPDDEISLVDLWLTLTRHKLAMAVIFFTVAAAGTLYALFHERTYEYKTTVEIGKETGENGEAELIQRPQTVQAKLMQSYIPLVLNDYARRHPEDEAQHKIQATVPKNSELVVLTATGPEEDAELYKRLLSSVVKLQIEDHRQLIEAERKLLQSKLGRLHDLERLLSTEIAQLDEQIERTIATQAKAHSQAESAPAAMTMLLVESEIQRNRDRLSSMRERLEVDLKNEKVSFEGRLSTLQETRLVTDPFRSSEPVGPSAALIIAFSVLIGAMLAVFGAFFAEFLGKVREAELANRQ